VSQLKVLYVPNTLQVRRSRVLKVMASAKVEVASGVESVVILQECA